MAEQLPDMLPEHLRRWPGLWIRRGDEIVPADQEDVDIARNYPSWADKGPLVRGRRLTIMAAHGSHGVGKAVRIIHVFEITEPGSAVYVMGPKPVLGECIDGQPATAPAGADDSALRPPAYDGRTLASPAVDYNFDITRYVFAEPGTHRIVWKVDDLASNVLTIEIGHEHAPAPGVSEGGGS